MMPFWCRSVTYHIVPDGMRATVWIPPDEWYRLDDPDVTQELTCAVQWVTGGTATCVAFRRARG